MRPKGVETSVGEKEWGEHGKNNWRRKRRSWRVHGYYLCPYTSREQEVPKSSFTPPLCHIPFSSEGVILWSLQWHMSEGCHRNSNLSLPHLLTVCSCRATSPLQALGKDHSFSKSAQWTGLAADGPFFCYLFRYFFPYQLPYELNLKSMELHPMLCWYSYTGGLFCLFQWSGNSAAP